MTARLCEANASFSSTRSRSAGSIPRRSRSLRTAGTGPMPITRGSTPATARPDERAERLDAELLRLLLAREHERGGAVVEPRRVAGGDRPAFPKRGLQPGQRLRGRLGTRVLVDGDVSDRDDLGLETPRSVRRRPAFLGAKREGVLILARDVPALGDVLARLAHRLEREQLLVPRVGEAPAERRVPHGLVPARERLVRLRHDERRAAHGLHPARDDDLRVAGDDGVRRGGDGGQAGRAEAVQR